MSLGLGAFADGLAQGRDVSQRMIAQAKAAKAAKAGAAPSGVSSPSVPAAAMQQPAQQSSDDSFGKNGSLGLGAMMQGFSQGQGIANQAAAKSAVSSGQADPFGGAWSALRSALGMQPNVQEAAATGMTQAATGTAEAQQKSIYPTN